MPERVRVEVPLRPSEKKDIILSLVYRIMDPDNIYGIQSGMGSLIIASSRCLSSINKLKNMIWRQRILDASRNYLKAGLRGDKITFLLHKQALAAGKASFVDFEEESPLGAVRVVITHPNPKAVIDWLSPSTVRGKPTKIFELPEPDCIVD